MRLGYCSGSRYVLRTARNGTAMAKTAGPADDGMGG